MTVVRQAAPEETVITLDGALDADAARDLETLVGEVAPEASLTLDFRRVRLFHDCAIRALAAAILGHHHVKLIGLSEHQYRLLHYMVGEPSGQHA